MASSCATAASGSRREVASIAAHMTVEDAPEKFFQRSRRKRRDRFVSVGVMLDAESRVERADPGDGRRGEGGLNVQRRRGESTNISNATSEIC